MSSSKNKNHLPEAERRKSIWDQFCDFTSLVGFRLLHSKHPPWLRVVSTALMLISTLLICLQTRYFWTRFAESKGQRIATVKENENHEMPQPRFLVCVSLQETSLLRGHGSVDLRELVHRYQLESGKSQRSLIERIQREMALLDTFFTQQSLENSTARAIREAGLASAKELRLLRQIGAALSFDDADTFSSAAPWPLTGNASEMQNAERADYQARRRRLDKCLIEYLWATSNPNAQPNLQKQSHQTAFIQCRLKWARELYAEFREQQGDYFSYVHTVWMPAEQLIVRSQFFGDGPGHWENSWQLDNGLCALGGPARRSSIGLKAVTAEENNFDYILIKANQLEAHPNARIHVFLVYDESENNGEARSGKQPAKWKRANSFQLIAGKNLEVTIRGISEILEEQCANKYPSGCVPKGHIYAPHVCKWCAPETRSACACANPSMYLAEFVGASQMRNCTLVEVMECGARQQQLYSQADCPNACTSVEYTADYAAYDLTLEMLNMSVLKAEQKYVDEQLLLIDKLNEFKWPRAVAVKQQRQTKIWNTAAQLDVLLADYYGMMVGIYRILYGSNFGAFSLPTVFAEDVVGTLGETGLHLGGFVSLLQLAQLQEEKLDLCEDTRNGPLANGLRQLGTIYLDQHFRKLSFRIWNPCPVSISNENCRRLVNGTGQFQSDEVLASLQQMIKSSAYRQCTLELSLMLNSTPANPICVVQFYSQAEENFLALNNTIVRLRFAAQELLSNLSSSQLPDSQCQQQKVALLQELLNSSVLGPPIAGKWDNAWLEAFRNFLRENSSMRMISDFLTGNMALITFFYRGLTFQHIVYHDDYTFWELMSDVGGVLGLYFGLTMVTLYELAVFASLVEREPAEAHRPPAELLFTRRLLYKRDPSLSTDRTVPILF